MRGIHGRTTRRLCPGQQLRPEPRSAAGSRSVTGTFTDKASGKDTRRPELDRLLAFVREGDTVVVHSMDRLARNLDDLRRMVQDLTGAACGSSSSRKA